MMDELHRRLLRWNGHDRGLSALQGLVRYGHVLTPREQQVVERTLAVASDRPQTNEEKS